MKTYTIKQASANLNASIQARCNFDSSKYWDCQIIKWKKRLAIAIKSNV